MQPAWHGTRGGRSIRDRLIGSELRFSATVICKRSAKCSPYNAVCNKEANSNLTATSPSREYSCD